MPTMTVQIRMRVDPISPKGDQETITADLLAMVEYLTLPDEMGSDGVWAGTQADLEVEYDPRTGLHVRSDLVSKVQSWFSAYGAKLQETREGAPLPLVDVAPTGQNIYYYMDQDGRWCSWHTATYLGSVAAGNEWILQIGTTRAYVRIGVRYPMLSPMPPVASLTAGT